MKDNIIIGKSLDQYKKRYKRNRKNLLWYTRKEVEEFDKNSKTKSHYLLKNRKWMLIDDVYYEVPKAPRLTWYLNLHPGLRVGLYVLLAGGITAGVVIPNLPKHVEETSVMKTNIENFNTLLSTNKENIHTCYDAISLIKKDLSIDVETAEKDEETYEYVFDNKTKQFIVMEDNKLIYYPKGYVLPSKNYLWKLVDTPDSTTEYSQYIKNNSNVEVGDVSVVSGLDVGEHSEVKSIHYKNDTENSKEVTFRTFSTDKAKVNLTIRGNTSDGNGDHIEHYGSIANLYIVTCSMNSYHEFGNVTWAEVYEGVLSLDKNKDYAGAENKGVISNVEIKASTTGEVKLDVANGGNVEKVHTTNEEIAEEVSKQIEIKVKKEEEADIKKEKIDTFEEQGVDTPVGNIVVYDNADKLVTYYSSLSELVDKDSVFGVATNKFLLTTDYDMSNDIVDDTWAGIGVKGKPFAATFDGNNHTITNYNLSGSLAKYVGIFGYVSGTIQNLILEDCHVSNTNEGRAPILVGHGEGSITLKNIKVNNCSVTSDKESNGLLCSHIEPAVDGAKVTFANIEFDDKCVLTAGLKENTASGMLAATIRSCGGTNSEVIIKNCTTRGTIDACGAVGAFIGQLGFNYFKITISDCNNYASITARVNECEQGTPVLYAGGFIGYAHNNTTAGSITIENSNNYGKVYGVEEHTHHGVGGFIGFSNQSIIQFNNCVNEGEIGSSNSTARSGGFIAWDNGEELINFNKCINKGTIKSEFFYGHFIGSGAHEKHTCTECSIEGSLVGEEATRTILSGEPEEL